VEDATRVGAEVTPQPGDARRVVQTEGAAGLGAGGPPGEKQEAEHEKSLRHASIIPGARPGP